MERAASTAAIGTLRGACARYAHLGLERLGDGVETELQALKLVAHVGGLFRVAREVEALGRWRTRWMARDPAFTAAGFSHSLHRLGCLLSGAEIAIRADVDGDVWEAVAGVARRAYAVEGGEVILRALGARGWMGDGGFVGITVAMACDGQILEFAATRPAEGLAGPRSLWHLPSFGPLAPSEFAHGTWRVDGLRRSGERGTLSGASVHPVADGLAAAYTGVDAASFAPAIDALTAAPLDPVVGPPPQFVAVDASLASNDDRWVMRDAQGWDLAVLSGDPDSMLGRNLAWLSDASRRPERWFGAVRWEGRSPAFEPWTALFDRPTRIRGGGRRSRVHLSLEALDDR